MFQWEEGARRLRELDDDRLRQRLERRIDILTEELRRRLGSAFTVEELSDLYAQGTGWADPTVGVDTWLTDAAFHRYVREAANYAGGRARAAATRR
jgi:hypothetical protein